MSKRTASLIIVLFLSANMIRFKALGFDPPIPVPGFFSDIASVRAEHGPAYSAGSAPIRALAVAPMALAPVLVYDRSWIARLVRPPSGLYWLMMGWLVATVPVSLVPLHVALSTFALAGASLTAAWYVLEFGWISLTRLVAGFIGWFAGIGVVWTAMAPSETVIGGRFIGVGLAATHVGEACGVGLLLVTVYRRELFRPLITSGLASLLAVCLVASGSRGAIGATVIALAAYAFVRNRAVLAAMVAGLLAVTPVLIFTPLLDDATLAVRRSESDIGLSGRLEVWESAASDAAELASSGVGYGLVFGGQSEYLNRLAASGSAPTANMTYSHNMLVGVFVVAGAVGLLILAAILVSYLRVSRRLLDPRLDAIFVFCVAIGISEATLLEAPMRVVSILLIGLLTTASCRLSNDADMPGARQEGTTSAALYDWHPASKPRFREDVNKSSGQHPARLQ